MAESFVPFPGRKKAGFFGAEQTENIKPVTHLYPAVGNPVDLYFALNHVWCAETCTARMRADWSSENKMLGQCSITAFLAQDLFGGRVYGIPLPDGGFHCYNVMDGVTFDLTSEQFGTEKLCYENHPEQFRENHFVNQDKKQRYELLKTRLMEYLLNTCDPLLEIDVKCEAPVRVSGAAMDIVMIPFSGTAGGSGFLGRIIGPGVDTQKIGKDGMAFLSARYMLEGTDAEGAACRIFIENQGSRDTGFAPKIVTDSHALSWLETESLCAKIEGTREGVLVRVYLQHS